jgi:hypothetical protein
MKGMRPFVRFNFWKGHWRKNVLRGRQNARQLRGRQNVQQNGLRGRQNIRPMNNNTSWKIMAINLRYII